MNSHRISQRTFFLFAGSGAGIIAGAAVVAFALVPHFNSFAGVSIARVVNACNQLVSTIAGRDILMSSIKASVFIILSLFFVITAVMVGKTGWSVYRCAHSLSKAVYRRNERVVRIAREIGLQSVGTVEDSGTRVFSIGLISPRVVISRTVVDMLTDEELRSVLLHEHYHCMRHDTARLFVTAILQQIFWFVPGMKRFADHVRKSIEIAADDHAILAQKDSVPLGSALMKILRQPNRIIEHNAIPAFSAVNDRIERLIDSSYRPRTRLMVIVPVLTVLFVALSVFFARGIAAAPQFSVSGTELHMATQAQVCPGFVPELLMSISKNQSCETGIVAACSGNQSRAR
ncbi:MAG: M56 family metallopeptidase [Patescibacteria group bacterium]|jgi:beta-lactamase regulating signal transducer with metallopeptidase domain